MMELKTIRRRKLKRAWRHVRKPAGVLKLPRPVKKTRRRKALSDEEIILRAFEKSMRKNSEAMRLLAKI